MNYQVKLQSANATLHLREQASSSGNVIASIPNGAILSPVIGVYKYVEGWTPVSYKGKCGFVSSAYIIETSLPAQTVAPSNNSSSDTTRNNSNNQHSNSMLTLTDETKKKLKIGLVVVGVAAAGFAVYKMTQKKNALPSSTNRPAAALNGVSSRRKRKKHKSEKSKTKTKSRKTKKIHLR
jgi:cytochrome b